MFDVTIIWAALDMRPIVAYPKSKTSLIKVFGVQPANQGTENLQGLSFTAD